jgi:folylpolyglutamate synthase/dihydropteroate synthase
VPAEVVADPAEAVARALDTAAEACVAGSLFLVGAVRERLNVTGRGGIVRVSPAR